MQQKQCLDRAPPRGAEPGAVLLRPLAGVLGAALVSALLFLSCRSRISCRPLPPKRQATGRIALLKGNQHGLHLPFLGP
jgi:hypothetical protein